VTFRGRLRFFFAIIVIVPTAVLGGVLLPLIRSSQEGKTDARLATGLDVAQAAYSEGRGAANDDLRRIAGDPRLAATLRSGDRRATAVRLRQLTLDRPGVVTATLFGRSGDLVARAGSDFGVAAAEGVTRRTDGARVGTLAVSVTDARSLVRSVASSTSLGVLVTRDGKPVASSVPEVRSAPDEVGEFEAGGEEYRGLRVPAEASGGREEVAVFGDAGEMGREIANDRLLISAALAGFLALALGGAIVLLRALQGQIGEFLRGARSLSDGRFDQPVAVKGNDEFAQLGREFNKMSKRLEAQIREVELKRKELEETIRRVGVAFASGLDPQATFDLTVQTALDACHAEAGRGAALDTRLLSDTTVGRESPAVSAALGEAVEGASSRGGDEGAVVVATAGAHALAMPLCAGADGCAGVIAISRSGQPFDREEADLLGYLAAQAAVSIDNADLHGRVQRDAVTDELTGLSNLRRMQAALSGELERGRRFDTPVGLVLLDIDNFKKVNDTYGHQQGDEVLRRVAAVLRGLSREIDEPARYGGEEMVVVLAQTPPEGAVRLAERMRQGIEDLRIPRLDGQGELRVTASFGVAAVPASASDSESLVAAADAALYRAKEAGKNRVELAEPVAALH
jgi:diguanylate cyclase (GGDEF)-like protein